jgi:hypothetical protein
MISRFREAGEREAWEQGRTELLDQAAPVITPLELEHPARGLAAIVRTPRKNKRKAAKIYSYSGALAL